MNKKNLILAAMLLVLVGVAYIFQGPGKAWFEKKGKEKNILSGIKIEDADRMQIDGKSGNTAFEKKDGKWKIAGTKDFKGLTGNLTCSPTGDCADPKIAVYEVTDTGSWNPNVTSPMKIYPK